MSEKKIKFKQNLFIHIMLLFAFPIVGNIIYALISMYTSYILLNKKEKGNYNFFVYPAVRPTIYMIFIGIFLVCAFPIITVLFHYGFFIETELLLLMPYILVLLIVSVIYFGICKFYDSRNKDFTGLYDSSKYELDESIKSNPCNDFKWKKRFNVNDFIAYDFETTGLDSKKDRIIEIGAVRCLNNKIVSRFQTFINIHQPLPTKIVELTGITDEMLASGEEELKAISDFLAWIYHNTDDNKLPLLIGHNSENFDNKFLENTLKRLNINVHSFAYNDTLLCARNRNIPTSNYKLATLLDYYNIENLHHHRADNDAEVCAKLWCALNRDVAKDVAIYKIAYLFNRVSEIKTYQASYTSKVNTVVDDSDYLDINNEDIDINENININEDIDVSNETVDVEYGFKEISGKCFCLANDFDYGDISSVVEYIKGFGGTVYKNMNENVDVLVVGNQGNEVDKQQEASKLNKEIVSEDEFFRNWI